MRVERVESSLNPLLLVVRRCCIRAIWWPSIWAATTSLAFAAAPAGKETALADGVIVAMPTGCEIWSDDAPVWRTLEMQKPNVRPDQRIRCASPGTLLLRLPGNGALEQIEFKSLSFEYLIPFGVDNPSLPAAKTPGRDAALDPQRIPSTVPMPTTKTARGDRTVEKDEPRLAAVETCDEPLGTLAIVEPQGDTQAKLRRYGLGSPTAVLRLLAQQSNCFSVVGRNITAGELTRGVGKRQMVAADYVMNPSVMFSETSVGGLGGFVGKLSVPSGSGKMKRADTSMALFDVRSGVQVAMAMGDSRKTSSDEVDALFGKTDGNLEGYKSTNEGKLVVASFASNWNDIIRSIKDKPSQKIGKAPASKQQDAASAATNLQEVNAGDTLIAKVDGVKVLAEPSDRANTIQLLTRSDRVVATGERRNGFIRITVASGDGWVKAILMTQP